MDGEVQVWCAELTAPAEALARAAQVLSPDEQARAGRFRFEHLSTRFVLAHAVLRSLLSAALAVPAGRIEFMHGEKGKPSLAWPESDLRFNLSHSGAMAVYALTRGCEVGIDVEQIRAIEDMDRIAERFFSAGECRDLACTTDADRKAAFFRCWTRKEAYIKAVGEGLSVPLDSFRVSLLAGEPSALLELDGDPGQAACWAMHSFDPGPGYVGAIALRDRGRRIRVISRTTAGDLLLTSAGPDAAASS